MIVMMKSTHSVCTVGLNLTAITALINIASETVVKRFHAMKMLVFAPIAVAKPNIIYNV